MYISHHLRPRIFLLKLGPMRETRRRGDEADPLFKAKLITCWPQLHVYCTEARVVLISSNTTDGVMSASSSSFREVEILCKGQNHYSVSKGFISPQTAGASKTDPALCDSLWRQRNTTEKKKKKKKKKTNPKSVSSGRKKKKRPLQLGLAVKQKKEHAPRRETTSQGSPPPPPTDGRMCTRSRGWGEAVDCTWTDLVIVVPPQLQPPQALHGERSQRPACKHESETWDFLHVFAVGDCTHAI